MFHLNYNHLYYFWMTQKKGSVTQAAEALYLTPQTITGQIRQLEDRLGGAYLSAKAEISKQLNWGSWFFVTPIRCFHCLMKCLRW